MAIIGKFVQATYPTAFQIYQLNVLTINFPSLLVIGNGSKKKVYPPQNVAKLCSQKQFRAFLTFWRQICFENLFLIQFLASPVENDLILGRNYESSWVGKTTYI